MSVTSINTDAAVAAAAAVLPGLPAGADMTPGPALDGATGLQSAIPAAGSKAVTATLSGDISGTIVIILAPETAAILENGPLGPQDLAVALGPALEDATAALGATLGAVRHEAAQALDADVALANATAADSITVVTFNAASGVVGSFVVLLDAVIQGGEVASFETLATAFTGAGPMRGVELLSDVEMGVTAELGRTRMTVRELLGLQPGSVVELDRAAGSPVDLLVNGTLVARGEVVVIDEEFGLRITEIIGYDAKKANG